MFTAIYHRHHSIYEEECDTLSEAIEYLASGWEFEQLFIGHIEKDGEVLFDHETTFQLCYGLLKLHDLEKEMR